VLVFQHRPVLTGLGLVALAAGPLAGQTPVQTLRDLPRAQVLVLGTFHFQDAGLDAYKPQFRFDIRSAERQRELEDVLERLARWKPTRIAVERRPEAQARLDSLFRMYPGGGADTLANEIYQIGIKLAKRLGHPGVFAVDAPASRLDSALTEAEWEKQKAALKQGPLTADWDARFTALYRYDDSMKVVRTLRETLLYTNSEERLRLGHGHYLVGNLLNGDVGNYFGTDGFLSGWYNRNLRIYSNVARLIRSPEERVLLLIGAGHVPILRHAFSSSPVVTLVNVESVLR
jgi:Family of unknown function (DUF5694)